MRRGEAPGAFGARTDSRIPEPSSKPRKRSPSDVRRDAKRAEQHQRRGLEAAEQDLRDIRNEREPLARRHLGAAAHIAPDELPAKDWTRASRAAAVSLDVDAAYRIKRGEQR